MKMVKRFLAKRKGDFVLLNLGLDKRELFGVTTIDLSTHIIVRFRGFILLEMVREGMRMAIIGLPGASMT